MPLRVSLPAVVRKVLKAVCVPDSVSAAVPEPEAVTPVPPRLLADSVPPEVASAKVRKPLPLPKASAPQVSWPSVANAVKLAGRVRVGAAIWLGAEIAATATRACTLCPLSRLRCNCMTKVSALPTKRSRPELR